MNNKLKIVTIGGGSSYTPELVEGFIKRYKTLPIDELWLVDIEEGKYKLEVIYQMTVRMIKEANIPIKVFATLDRREALKDADFVTTQFRVGQLSARDKDERIPNAHNRIGQETNGAGGMFKGLRTIPVILDICKDIEDLCPEAWLINFTNPSGMITEAVLSQTNIRKVIGLCNGPINIHKELSSLMNVNDEDLYVEFAGLNHMVFAKNIYYNGENITKEAVKKYTEKNKINGLKNIEEVVWDKDFLTALNMIPIDYLKYYYMTEDILKQQIKDTNQFKNRARVVQKVEQDLFDLYKNEELNYKPKELELRGGAFYSEAACKLINSIYTDSRDIQTINVRNNGAILDIDENSAVEVNCVITKQGPIPLTTGHLPDSVKGLVMQIKSFERMVIKACITGKYEDVLLALSINPLSQSVSSSRAIIDELVIAHKEYLRLKL